MYNLLLRAGSEAMQWVIQFVIILGFVSYALAGTYSLAGTCMVIVFQVWCWVIVS